VEHPYACDVCLKTFRDAGSLKVHQCLHTEKRPYCCDMCNITFSEKSSLREHQSMHKLGKSISL
jgi:KRAB domain-containing zinc finger protein